MTEKEKFTKWHEEAVKNGLIDIKSFPNSMLPPEERVLTEEDFYGSVNALLNGKIIPHPEGLFDDLNPVFSSKKEPSISDMINAPGIPHLEGLFPPENIGPDNVARF